MQENKITATAIIGIITLLVGAIAGYFYGQSIGASKGAASGRNQLLTEQAQAVAEAEAARRAELQDAANPFKNSYTNPFGQ